MLRTNSKEVIAKIREWINAGYDTEYGPDVETLPEKCKAIYADYMRVVGGEDYYKRYTYAEKIYEYCTKLPSIIPTEDFILHSAINFVGDILEETPAERERYTESDAENLACYLIFREIEKQMRKAN